MNGAEQVATTEMLKSRWPRPLSALRHRNFRLYWLAQLVSLSGSWAQIIALSWLVYRLTDSPLMLGLVDFVALLPVGFVSLVGGVISDRFPRRNLILITEIILAVQALILTSLAWTGAVQVWHIVIITFVVGAGQAIEQPARVAFVMDIVGKEEFTNAIGLNSSIANAARSLGPIVAGLLISTFGEASCFLMNTASYLAVIIVLLLMRLPTQNDPGKPMRLKGDLVDGLKYMWQNQTIKGLLLFIVGSSTFAQSYIVLMPVFARDVLQINSSGYGLLMGAIGIGSVCGALTAGNVGNGQRGKWLLIANFTLPVFLILFASTHWIWLSIAALILVSGSQFLQQVLANSSLQLAATDEFRGRVASLFALFTVGLMRVGGVQAGALAQYWNPSFAVIMGAIITLLWGLLIIWRMPFIRQL
jgi:predicted MFS family arabinose efflux permease